MVTSADLGYFTGSVTYSPPWGPPVSISIGTGPDASGVAWIWNRIDGWDGPDVSGQVLQRAGDHGGWPTAQYYAARAITLTITASAPSQALRDVARATLQQAIPVNDFATLVYNEPIPVQADVRRASRLAESYPTLTDVTFTCVLVAPDPRKYSAVLKSQVTTSVAGTGLTIPADIPATIPATTAPGSLIAVNAGTFETRPVITVTNPSSSAVTGVALANSTTGQAVSWSALTVNPGDVLVADFGARMGFYNGSYRPADIASAWWSIWPGGNTLQVTGAGLQMTCDFRDAWL